MNRINSAKDIMMDLDGATEDGSRRTKGSGIWSRKSFGKEKSENLKVLTYSQTNEEQRQQLPACDHSLDKRSSESSLFSGATNESTMEKGFQQINNILNDSAESSLFSGTSSIHEASIVGVDSKDGIELMADNGEMKILHVVGNNTKNAPEEIVLNQLTPVHFAQFSTNYHVVCDSELKNNRISQDTNENNPTQSISLLEKFEVLDEERAMRNELIKSSAEIASLESEQVTIMNALNDKESKTFGEKCVYADCQKDWDIDVYLDEVDSGSDRSTNQISPKTRSHLQRIRGNCFHAAFEDPRLCLNFVAMCSANAKRGGTQVNEHDYLNIQECEANAAAVRHVAILNGLQEVSCFVSRDDGCADLEGKLPSRLSSRLINEGFATNDIKYLSCGPEDSYYAELKSGDCLWGISGDNKFNDVLAHIDVHRVAFGPFHTRNGELETSWITISKNGRLAWRNIPSGLHKILKERRSDMAVPCEISIGLEGSYFVKFLDGSCQYCLPIHISQACDKIAEQGGVITNITLNTEDSQSYIIRHT